VTTTTVTVTTVPRSKSRSLLPSFLPSVRVHAAQHLSSDVAR
jgi:hypothetical protein